MRLFTYLFALTLLCAGCKTSEMETDTSANSTISDVSGMNDPQFAKLSKGDMQAFAQIQANFEEKNPGYTIDYQSGIESLKAEDFPRILFIQEGQPDINLSTGVTSQVTVGDIVLLAAGVSLEADSALSLLSFKVPEEPNEEIPAFIRPDWDMNITDVPGGCATDSNAYRRILLTWKKEVGEYVYHALNAHRVRIMDSFSHYHPQEGGFDEFYLVQMALPDARIITSTKVAKIENPNGLTKESAQQLLKSHRLEVGDLVYLPRGTMHRGLGGVLAQVITVPGFIPGAEIGVDHHLKSINERLSLSKEEQLPYNLEASTKVVVK